MSIADTKVNKKDLSAEIAKRHAKATETLELAEAIGLGQSVREAALAVNIAKSTAHDRLMALQDLNIDRKTFEFFNSQSGILVIQRFVNSLIFVGHHVCNLGTRSIEMILRSAGLDRFIASSHASLAEHSKEMQELIIAFGEDEQALLAQGMPQKKITVLEDETWLDTMYLVAMDAKSRFILLEESADKRDSDTWFSAMAKATSALNVQIVQVTSDEAKGLIRHAEVLLGAHHSPDLFHVQQEISRNLGAAIGRLLKQSEKKVLTLQQELTAIPKHRSIGSILWGHFVEKRRGRPKIKRDYAQLEIELNQATKELDGLKILYSRYRAALQGISEDYHPIDLKTGTIQSPKELEKLLLARFDEFRNIAKAADVGEHCFKAIEKAERVIPLMISTVCFVQSEWEKFIASLNLTPKESWQVRTRVLTALYLDNRANKSSDQKGKQEMSKLSQELLTAAWSSSLGERQNTADKRNALLCLCQNAVDLFQRSSSPIEGRNGALSQRFGAKRGLSRSQLRTQTILANYYIENIDGTTAAERFFEKPSRSLVEWVFERMPLFAVPRKSNRVPLQLVS